MKYEKPEVEVMQFDSSVFMAASGSSYWNGVKAGINFTLQNPKEAEQCKDNVEILRLRVASAIEVVDKISKALGKLFNNDKE